MEFFIVRGLSSILEAVLWTYFIVSFAKILSKNELHFSKKQLILLTVIIFVCSIIGRITGSILPLLNALIACPLILLSCKFILKIEWWKALTIIISNVITLIVTELISVFSCMSFFKITSDTFVNIVITAAIIEKIK